MSQIVCCQRGLELQCVKIDILRISFYILAHADLVSLTLVLLVANLANTK